MAILKKGIHGPFTGRVGNIVGYELNGQNVIRSLPNYTKRKPSPLALINRQRMAAVSTFLKPMQVAIRFGYRNIAPKGSRVGPFQTAQSHVFKDALDYGPGNVPFVNPEKVLVFRGKLKAPKILNAHRYETGIRLQWDPTNIIDGVLVALAYCPEERFIDFQETLAFTKKGTVDWELSARILDSCANMHVYVGVYNVMLGELSDSVYAGCL